MTRPSLGLRCSFSGSPILGRDTTPIASHPAVNAASGHASSTAISTIVSTSPSPVHSRSSAMTMPGSPQMSASWRTPSAS
jgi:hypothetical protein